MTRLPSTLAAMLLACVCGGVTQAGDGRYVAVTECDTNGDQLLDRQEILDCAAKLEAKVVKPTAIEQCETDGHAGLDASELRECARYLLPAVADAQSKTRAAEQTLEDFVGDALDKEGRDTATLDVTRKTLERYNSAAAEEKPRVLFSDRMIFARKLSDTLDPRKSESVVPFILSFTDDRGAGDDTFVAAGEITYDTPAVDIGTANDLSFAVLPTLGIDLTTKKERFDSSIVASVPFRWTKTNPGGFFGDMRWSIEPKYITDRDFRRDAYELAFGWNFSSLKLRAGYDNWLTAAGRESGKGFRFSWTPSIGLETGVVTDSGDSAALEVIRLGGEYTRLAPSVAMKLTTPLANHGVILSASYTERIDLTDSWNKGLATATIQYNLTKSLALTLARRKGRKPPDFAAVDDVLLGIGLLQTPKK